MAKDQSPFVMNCDLEVTDRALVKQQSLYQSEMMQAMADTLENCVVITKLRIDAVCIWRTERCQEWNLEGHHNSTEPLSMWSYPEQQEKICWRGVNTLN